MIFETLNFLASQLNAYMGGPPPSTERVVLGNVARALEDNASGMKGKVILSLVNVEEDRVARQTEGYTKTETTVQYKHPPLLLNLYVLVSVNRDEDYKEGLKMLGQAMQFFQFRKIFAPSTHPELDQRIAKLMIDLYTMSFEQVNHLWSTLGGKYLPSALYKVRQLVLDENSLIGESGLITEISLNGRMKPASP